MLKFLLSMGAAGVVLAVAVAAVAALPEKVTPPTVSDSTPSIGSTLNVGSPGVWNVDPPETSRTYQWCTPGCGSVLGSGSSYTVTPADFTNHISIVLRETVTNDDGSDFMDSSATATVTAGPLDHIVVSPSSASISAGGSQAYTAQGFDAANNSLGNVTSGTTFSITPNGSCTGASCTAATAGVHTVTGTNAGKTDTASLTVTVGPLDHLVISPSSASIPAGGSQAYTAQGFDAANNSLGNVTSGTTFSITPNGSCTGASCTAATAGVHTVTGTNAGKTDTASLTVTVGPLDHLVVSPDGASISAGGSQAYTVGSFDVGNNALGNVAATLSISPDGSCSGLTCTATVPGVHTVTASFGGKTDTASLTVTAVPPVNTVAPVVNDLTPTVGQVLTYTAGTWTGYPPPTVTVQWCVPTCGSSLPAGSSYTVLAADVGKQISVRETAVNNAPGGTVTKDSAATGAVTGPPVNATAPTIGNTAPQIGQTLTGSSGNWTAFPGPPTLTLKHQWQRCNAAAAPASCVSVGSEITTTVSTPIPPATHTSTSQYAVTAADLGSTFRLRVTAANGVGQQSQLFTSITQVVQAAPAQVSGQAPAITGTLARGQTVTASSGQWTGFAATGAPVALTHQWQRCAADGSGCVPIGGPVAVPANAAATCTTAAPCGGTTTYLLTDADMGSTLRVVVTASNGVGSAAPVTSALTGVVQGPPIILQSGGAPDPSALPKISGLPQSGLSLGASTGTWSAFPDTLTYTYQWLRCSGTDVGSCAAIGGATQVIYAAQDADVGQRLRVRVTASNGVAPNGVGTSEATGVVSAKAAGGGGDGVDLLISASSNSSGARATFRLTVTNAGNRGATGASVNVNLSGPVTLVSANASGGCSGSSAVSCGLGAIAAGASATATVVVQATQTGTIGLSAAARSAEADVNPSNNDVSLTAYVIASGSTPSGGTGNGGTSGGTVAQTAGTTDKKFVAPKDVRLKARRVGKTWVATTTFSLLSGRADLRLVVTKNGLTEELPLQEGSRFGGIVVEGTSDEVAFTARKSGSFPVKVVLPAKGFSLTQIYVIRITASAGGSSSSLNIGFKGAPLVKKTATALARGATQLVSSTFTLPAAKSTTVQALVSPAGSTKKLSLLKGSRLGTVSARSTTSTLTMKATRGGTFPVSVVLSGASVSPKRSYVINVHARSANGLWTDYEIRFTPKAASARALTGERIATP